MAARENATKPPPIASEFVTPPTPKAKVTAPVTKKDTKKSLKGVLVKKKSTKPPGETSSGSQAAVNKDSNPTNKPVAPQKPPRDDGEDDEPQAKRRKLGS